MSEIILESKLNYHTQQELDNFGSFLLSKIIDIRTCHDGMFRYLVDDSFANSEREFPERHLAGVTRRVVGKYIYYVFQRSIKGKKIIFWNSDSLKVYKYAIHFARKHNKSFYKGNHKNNFPKK